MVRMKALKTFRPADATVGVHPGDEYEVKENIAAQHERSGLAVRIGKHAPKPAPQVRSARGPLSPAGGRAGKGEQSSSSRPARAPRKRAKSSRKRPSGNRGGAGES